MSEALYTTRSTRHEGRWHPSPGDSRGCNHPRDGTLRPPADTPRDKVFG